MSKLLLILFLGLAVRSQGQEWFSKWEKAGATWRDKWVNTLDALGSYPEGERFEILGAAVRIASSPQNPGKDEIFRRAQKLLLALPGHAEYYVNEIKQAKAAATTPEELRGRDGKISWSNYNRVRSAAFDTLEHLPSVETVRALGGFLGDEEDPNAVRPGDEMPDAFGPGSNSGLAIMALRTLIHDGPVKSKHEYLEIGETQAWQKWYEQIKAGNGTFRFEGDSTEYDLDGPAPKQKLDHIARDRKRDEERSAGRKKGPSIAESTPEATVVAPKPLSIAVFVAGCALCAAAVWYFVRHQARSR